MGRISQLFEPRGAVMSSEKAVLELFDITPSTTGVRVTEESALTYAAVFACVRVIAETVGSLPLNVYRRSGDGGKEKALDHPLYMLLHDAPNDHMTAMALRKTLMAHALLWGNAYALIERNGAGRVTGLQLLSPSATWPEWVDVNDQRALVYKTVRGNQPKVYLPHEILHIAGLGFDGVRGYSPIALHREGISLALAMQQMAGRVISNDARPGVVVTHPKSLGEKAVSNIQESWNKQHQGIANKGRIAVLEEGADIKTIETMPLADAQFLEQRKFSRSEIASIFLVPPHKIGDLERATFSNVEQQNIQFVTDTIRPWLVAFEQAIQLRLFTGLERRRYFAEHNLDGLLRADTAARSQFYKDMWDRGVFSINDILSLENRNSIGADGDQRFVPLNMVPLSAAGKIQTAPAPNPPPKRSLAPVYQDAMSRILRRAQADILREAEKRVSKGDIGGLSAWLGAFFHEHQGFAERALTPACEADGCPASAATLAERHVEALENRLSLALSEAKEGQNDAVLALKQEFSALNMSPIDVFEGVPV